jgi:hypothetical protein
LRFSLGLPTDHTLSGVDYIASGFNDPLNEFDVDVKSTAGVPKLFTLVVDGAKSLLGEGLYRILVMCLSNFSINFLLEVLTDEGKVWYKYELLRNYCGDWTLAELLLFLKSYIHL